MRTHEPERTHEHGGAGAGASASAGARPGPGPAGGGLRGWEARDQLPLALLRIGELQLACDPTVISMIVPLPFRLYTDDGLLDLAEGLGIAVPNKDPNPDTDGDAAPAGRIWQQLELRDGDIEVVIPDAVEVHPVPRACVRRMPALLASEATEHGSAIDGLLGYVHEAPGLADVVWLVDLPRLVQQLYARLRGHESGHPTSTGQPDEPTG